MDIKDSTCPICATRLKRFEFAGQRHAFNIGCVRCGNFEVTEIAYSCFEGYIKNDNRTRALLSYGVRQLQKKEEWPVVDIQKIETLMKQRLPDFPEQLRNFLDLVRSNVDAPGEKFRVDAFSQMSIIGATSIEAFEVVIKHLVGEGVIDATLSKALSNQVNGIVSFTGKGWMEYESMVVGAQSLKSAFMAMDFKNPNIYKIFYEVYKPLCREFDFDLNIVTKRAGIIDVRIREQIINSKLLIADLSDDNSGAYWEAGLAEGLGIPVIYSCERKKFELLKTHFDTNHLTTAMWSIDDAEFSKSKLEEILIDTFKNVKS